MNEVQKSQTSSTYSLILLKQLVKTDFKLRYQGSVLGYLWSLLKPLFLFGILYIVFVEIVGVDYGVQNSGAYLLLGIVLWSFFAEVTGGSVTSIVGKGDLIRKLNFPKKVIVQAVAFSALINLTLNMIVVALFLIIGGADVDFRVLLIPLLFFELFIFSIGVGYFLSASYVRLRDINYIWDVCMQALFYLTPILFPITFAPLWAQKILMMNPLAQIIQDLRYLLVSPDTTTITDVFDGRAYIRIIPVLIVIFVMLTASYYFRSRSKNFAEDI